jgi:Family of unknown function (DUF6130)
MKLEDVEARELVGTRIKNHRLPWLLAGLISLTYWLHSGIALAAGGLNETAPPAIIAQLATAASGSPQVLVISPRPDEVLNTNNVSVNFQVQGVPIFKNAALGLGPHLHVLLDRAPYQSIYDLAQPLTLPNLTPGTHTLQVLLAKPWHESWKNPGALAQVTFHVFAKSAELPVATAPTLVYNEPDASYGAEPFLLDFYLANAPSHLDAQQHQINDWRVRATINTQSFEVDRAAPFYLKGLKPGANLVKLEYLNAQGQSIDSMLRVVNYQPNGTDSLSRLLRNELPLNEAVALFDPSSKNTVALAPVINTPSPLPVALPAVTPPLPVMPPVASMPLPAPILAMPTTVPLPSSPPLLLPVLVTPPINLGVSYPVTPLPVAELPHPLPSAIILPTPSQVAPIAHLNAPVAEVPRIPIVPIKPVIPPVAVVPVVKKPELKSPAIEKSVEIAPSINKTIELPTLPTIPSPTITPVTGENVMEFNVLAREFWHTLSFRIKKFTNSIPPTVAQWRQDIGHWIGDRSQAMHSSQKAVNQPDAKIQLFSNDTIR